MKFPKLKLPKIKIRSFFPNTKLRFPSQKIIAVIYVIAFIVLGIYSFAIYRQNISIRLNQELANREKEDLNIKLQEIQKNYEEIKNEDQFVKNKTLEDEIRNIQNTYKKAVSVYESLLDLKDKTPTAQAEKDMAKFDDALAIIFSLLSQRKYIEADEKLNILSADIKKKSDELVAIIKIPDNVTASNSPPGSGYSRQSVTTDAGTFLVGIVAGDLVSTKVIVDTASDSDCSDNCPVMSLSEFVSRSGAFAGINGTYFCPASYPTCSGKTNSFDLLVMNYKKTYFNSGNNVYSSNPAVIFGDGYIRFVASASEWGRDTSPNGVLSNYPLLLMNSEIKFSGGGDEKSAVKGGRSFVASKGNTVYIGVVFSATIAESAKVMKALGMENAINLDNGGSTALWSGGYKAGPGRNIPNAILFVKK